MVEVSADMAQFRRAAKTLRAAGPDLRKQVAKELKRAVRPLAEYVAVKGASEMPRSGGLAERLAEAVPTVTATYGANPAVRFSLRNKFRYDLDTIDRKGTIRHPVYANPDQTRKEWHWVSQAVRAGVWTRAFESGVDPVITDVEHVIGAFADKIERDLG